MCILFFESGSKCIWPIHVFLFELLWYCHLSSGLQRLVISQGCGQMSVVVLWFQQPHCWLDIDTSAPGLASLCNGVGSLNSRPHCCLCQMPERSVSDSL